MKTRNFDYLNTETLQPVYSFQVKLGNVWHNVHDNGRPLLFDTEKERDVAREEMAKRQFPQSLGVFYDH
jgi:hypothetical protein